MSDRSPSEPLKVHGGVVNPAPRHDRGPGKTQGQGKEEGRVGQESGKDAAGNVRDPDLDPADAPKRPTPGTGGTDGAPMG